jgi:hypothetical protein
MKAQFRRLASILVPGSVLVATFVTSPPAIADGPEMSLKDRQAWDEISKEIDGRAQAASEKCGTTITAKFDIPSFKGQDLFTQSPTAACRDVVNNVSALCGANDVGKASVKKSISTITCRRSNDGTKLGREGKALTVHLDPAKTGITGKEKGVSSWRSALLENLVADPPPNTNGSEMLLREREQWESIIKEIDERGKSASEKCGTPITAKLDIASFKGQDLWVHPPTGACRDAVNTLANLCARDVGKSAVQKNVSTVTCKRSDNGTKVTRDGKALSVQLDPVKSGVVSKSGGTSWKSALEEIL